MSYCGSTIPHEFVSIGNSVKISFKSDAMVARPGFRLEYSEASCDRSYDTDHGRILSPRWPSSLPYNTQCSFSINVPPSKTISVYFRYFSLASSANCTDTYLEIRDGDTDTAPLLAKVQTYLDGINKYNWTVLTLTRFMTFTSIGMRMRIN